MLPLWCLHAGHAAALPSSLPFGLESRRCSPTVVFRAAKSEENKNTHAIKISVYSKQHKQNQMIIKTEAPPPRNKHTQPSHCKGHRKNKQRAAERRSRGEQDHMGPALKDALAIMQMRNPTDSWQFLTTWFLFHENKYAMFVYCGSLKGGRVGVTSPWAMNPVMAGPQHRLLFFF